MPSTVAVSGSSGLIGTALTEALTGAGYRMRHLVRRPAKTDDEITWNPAARLLDERRLSDIDVIVNLAGETIGKRWSAGRRRAIRESRVRGTETIVGAIERSGRPVTLINASAVGYYGDRGPTPLDETSSNGRGYLAEVCRDWEAATKPIAKRSRVVILRNGVVLSTKGGALPAMLRPFRLFVGGKIGNGRQYLSWIDLDDAVRAIVWVIEHAEIRGVVNVVSPNPVSNTEFTRAASEVLGKPAWVPVPAFALKLLFGEMAGETILASQRVAPQVLVESGFRFSKESLRDSLEKWTDHARGI